MDGRLTLLFNKSVFWEHIVNLCKLGFYTNTSDSCVGIVLVVWAVKTNITGALYPIICVQNGTRCIALGEITMGFFILLRGFFWLRGDWITNLRVRTNPLMFFVTSE